MEHESKWLISIQIKNMNYKISIYENGYVYGSRRNELLGVMTQEGIDEIKALLKPYMPFLKKERYINARNSIFILKINSTSRKHRDCIKIIDGKFDNFCYSIFQVVSGEATEFRSIN